MLLLKGSIKQSLMPNGSELPNKLWAEAVATAVYVRNRLPTIALQDQTTSHEMCTGHKTNLSHLRVFGCVCYAQIPDQLRQNLDEKAESMAFVGHSTQKKGYRLYQESTQRIVIGKNTVFDEQRFDSMQTQTENGKQLLI